ncbi:MAG: hypothetical protein FWE31_04510 [Firmicutes bacterium]|nr:hypothetical protein [Bacillota bacterium]
MTIKTIIKRAAEVLGLSDVVELESNFMDNANYRVLLRCAYLSSAFLASRLSKRPYSDIPVIKTGNERFKFEFAPAVLEFGILSEYAFINGMFNEAQVWNEKMRELLFNKMESVTMPASF